MKRTGIQWRRGLSRFFLIHRGDIRCGYAGAIAMFTLSIVIRLLSGSPYRVYYLLRGSRLLPSLAFVTLINLLFSIAMGFACGLVLSCRRRQAQCAKYQSGMLFILLTVCWFITYPLIFRGCLLWMAILSLGGTWILTLCCSALFFRVHPFSGWISAVFLIWLTYLILILFGSLLWI